MPPSTKPAINQGPCPAGETSRTRLGPANGVHHGQSDKGDKQPETQAQGPRGAPDAGRRPNRSEAPNRAYRARAEAQSPLPRRTTKERTEPGRAALFQRGTASIHARYRPVYTMSTAASTAQITSSPLRAQEGARPAEGVERGQEARGEQRRQQDEGSHRQQRCRRPQKQQEEAVRTAQVNQQAEHRER